APPRQRLAGGGEVQAGQVDDRSGRLVFALDPLGVVERQRPGAGGDDQVGPVQPARRLGGVHVEHDRPRLGGAERGGGPQPGQARRAPVREVLAAAHGVSRSWRYSVRSQFPGPSYGFSPQSVQGTLSRESETQGRDASTAINGNCAPRTANRRASAVRNSHPSRSASATY